MFHKGKLIIIFSDPRLLSTLQRKTADSGGAVLAREASPYLELRSVLRGVGVVLERAFGLSLVRAPAVEGELWHKSVAKMVLCRSPAHTRSADTQPRSSSAHSEAEMLFRGSASRTREELPRSAGTQGQAAQAEAPWAAGATGTAGGAVGANTAGEGAGANGTAADTTGGPAGARDTADTTGGVAGASDCTAYTAGGAASGGAPYSGGTGDDGWSERVAAQVRML